MEISAHITKQANAKNIPLEAISAVIGQRVGLLKSVQSPHKPNSACTQCGVQKQDWSPISPIVLNGVSYGVKVVVCTRCDLAITVYLDERTEGNTPIRLDQWARNVRQYSAKCYDCGKRLVVSSTDLETCKRQTSHTCKGGATRHIMKG